MITKSLEIIFGALVPPLKVQLKTDLPEKFQIQADNITGLYLHNLLTEAEAHRVRKRLLAAIKRHLQTNVPVFTAKP